MFAVIRIRGLMDVDHRVEDTMRLMRLKTGNNCTLLPETADVKGMLQKCKDFVTWGEVSKETLAKMMVKRLRAKGHIGKVDSDILRQATGFDSFEKFAEEVISGKASIVDNDKLQPTFGLTPPSGGFKSVREKFPRGDIGYRGKDINALIERMI